MKKLLHKPPAQKLSFISCLLLCGLFAATHSGAQTLYWETTSGTWTTASTTPKNWATSPGGTPTADWINNNSAIVEAEDPSISINGVLTVANFSVLNGATFSGSSASTRSLTITGSGTGDFTINGSQVGTVSNGVILAGSSAYDGTITAGPGGNGRNDITLASTTGAGVLTKINLTGGRMGISLNSATITIGELTGNSSSIVSGAFGSVANTTKTLKLQQTSNTTFSGTMSDGGVGDRKLAFIKDGSGRLRLNGVNTYVGTTTVTAGALYENGSSSGQGAFSVNGGATLGGTGSIGLSGANVVTIANGGQLDPGDVSDLGVTSVGTLVIGGATSGVGLSFSGSATIAFALGTTKDMITLSGSTMVGSASGGAGSILFDFSYMDGATASTYDLISFGGTTQGIALNAFAISSASASAGWAGTFSYGGDGNTLQFNASAVPEPATYLLFGMGGLAILAWRRRLVTKR